MGTLVTRWELPDWADDYLIPERRISDPVQRMELAIELSRRNVEHGTGGPFGAAIFNGENGALVAVGVNRVVPTSCSHAHAEMMAVALAQTALETFDLRAPGLPDHELVTSCEPCAMCFGAIPWSGVRKLVCGARDEDARAIGFDEGPKLADWSSALEARGIEVVTDLCRDQAREVLQTYAAGGGSIYNSRQG